MWRISFIGTSTSSQQPFSANIGAHVATEHSAPQGNVRSRRAAPRAAGGNFRNPAAIAIKAIFAEPDRSHWKLPAPAMWNCDLYHRPVRGHIRRVRDRSLASPTRK